MKHYKFIDGFWSINMRGMGRYAQIYSKLENVKLLNPKCKIPRNKVFKYIYYIIWEQFFFQINGLKSEANQLVFAYNSPPLLKFGNYESILIIHDLIFLEKKIKQKSISARLLSYYRKYTLIYGLKNIDKIVFVSETTKNIFFKYFTTYYKYKIIPNMVILKKSNEEIPINNFDNNKFNLLFITGKSRNKNSEVLEDTIKAISKNNIKQGKKVHFHIIGLENLSTNIPQEIITIYKNCSEITKNTLLKNVDCFISISIQEGFGIPIIEAAINKTAIICSDIPVYREICGLNAFFVNPYSHLELCELINNLKKLQRKDFNKKTKNNIKQMYKVCLKKYSLCEF